MDEHHPSKSASVDGLTDFAFLGTLVVEMTRFPPHYSSIDIQVLRIGGIAAVPSVAAAFVCCAKACCC